MRDQQLRASLPHSFSSYSTLKYTHLTVSRERFVRNPERITTKILSDFGQIKKGWQTYDGTVSEDLISSPEQAEHENFPVSDECIQTRTLRTKNVSFVDSWLIKKKKFRTCIACNSVDSGCGCSMPSDLVVPFVVVHVQRCNMKLLCHQLSTLPS